MEIYFDSCIIIYLVEEHPEYADRIRARLSVSAVVLPAPKLLTHSIMGVSMNGVAINSSDPFLVRQVSLRSRHDSVSS